MDLLSLTVTTAAQPTYITGMGYHHPERVVDNAHFEANLDTTDAWIRERTGIIERRYADETVDTSDLGAIATRRALHDAGWNADYVDLLVCATSTPDALIPSTACYIANKLGMPSIAFDVNAACSGFVYGLATAQGMMAAQGAQHVILCAAEKYSRVTDQTDRANAIFWGDAAASVALQAERPERGMEVVDILLKNRNEGADLVRTPIGGYFTMVGNRVKTIASDGMAGNVTELLERNGLEPADLRALVAHQANLRLVEKLAASFDIDDTRHWTNVEKFGNQGAAGAVTSLMQGIESTNGDLRDGDLFLMVVYGSGFTGGSVLLRWVDAATA